MTRYLILFPAILLAASVAVYLWLCHECQFADLWGDDAYD